MPEDRAITIETAEGVKPHGYHLGTDRGRAELIIFGMLRQPGVMSIALYEGSPLPGFGGKLVHIYDWRDLPENSDDPDLYDWASHVPAKEEDQ